MEKIGKERRSEGRDRRGCQRIPIAGRVTWNTVDDPSRRTGWLSDLSESGLAFITRQHRNVSIGDALRLSTMPGGGSLHRVARIAPYGVRDALIACVPLMDAT